MGESPVYVKEQMGHSSIQVTVDLYGHLIPGGNKQAVDRLDDPMESRWAEGKTAPQTHPTPAGVGQMEAERLEKTERVRRIVGVDDGYVAHRPYENRPLVRTSSDFVARFVPKVVALPLPF